MFFFSILFAVWNGIMQICLCMFFFAPNDKRLNSKLFHVWYQNVMKTHTDTQKTGCVNWLCSRYRFSKKVLPNSSFFAPYGRIQYHHLNRIEFFFFIWMWIGAPMFVSKTYFTMFFCSVQSCIWSFNSIPIIMAIKLDSSEKFVNFLVFSEIGSVLRIRMLCKRKWW